MIKSRLSQARYVSSIISILPYAARFMAQVVSALALGDFVVFRVIFLAEITAADGETAEKKYTHYLNTAYVVYPSSGDDDTEIDL